MKLINFFLVTLLTLFSFTSFACLNPISKTEALKAIALDTSAKPGCSEQETQCLCYDGITWQAAEIVDEIVNGDPIYEVNSQSACSDEADCQTKLAALVCDSGFTAAYRLDNPQVYCYKITGYEQVNTGKEVLANNPTKLAQYQSAEAAKAQLAAIEAAGVKAKADCDRVLNLIRGFNLLPGRTVEQTTQMQTVFADIQKALQDGRPGVAKALIQAAQPDGTIVTEAMKAAALEILKDW